MKNVLLILFVLLLGCQQQHQYDLVIRNGIIYDGNGGEPVPGDIAIHGDTIAFIGQLKHISAKTVIDANGLAIAPGFINMLSWANESLIEDGRSLGDIRQGVTLEVMGEGHSMGPLNAEMKTRMRGGQTDVTYEVAWNTLGEYLSFLETKGVSCNVASFIGATTVRAFVLGEENISPSPEQLDSMRSLVAQAMQEGAMGVASSLIYPPAFFAKTNELIALCQEAARYDGLYISHVRNEGNKLLEAIEELITISREANIRAEIYHLKAAGKANWHKMDEVIGRVEKARAEGQHITADMYTYTAAATGLTASFPPSLQDGGFGNLWSRLQDPVIRDQMKKAMNTDAQDWDNLYYGAGSPEKVILLGFRRDSLKKYTGKTLAEVAQMRGTSAEDVAIDLIVQDSTRVSCAYFLMQEENVKKQIALPWMSFGSDEGSYAPEGVFLESNPHPRAYGNFARVLGKYVREEKIITLQEAIRKLTKLPAQNLKIEKRGELKTGYYADVVVFDPETVRDHSTFDKPHQLSTGVIHVFVNGEQVLQDQQHTGAMPGRFVKGPGYEK